MDFFEVIRKRRSVRAFTGDTVKPADLKAVLGAVSAAPSAGNLQAYEVVVVRDEASRRKLAKAALEQSFIAQAPVCIVFLASPRRSATEYGQRGVDLYCIQDATIAACHAHLACTALGLASTWVGAFSDEGVRAAVSASRDLLPVCILPVGHPAEAPTPTPRRPLSDLIHEESMLSGWPRN